MELNHDFFFSLLKSHEEEHHYASDTLQHFNFFLERRLARMIRDHCSCNVIIPPSDGGFPVQKRHVVTFTDMNIQRPTIPKTDGVSRGLRVSQHNAPPLFPHEALIRGINYSAGIYVSIKHEIFSGDPEELESEMNYHNIFFFNMPIPVYCIACNLSDPKLSQDRAAHVDPEDRGGYWIVRGMVKVVQPQKVQRNNILIVRKITKGQESWIEGNIRSIRADKRFRSTSTLNCYLINSGVITIDIPYLKSNQNIICAFRLLGFNTQAHIEEMIFDSGSEEVEAQRRLLMATFASSTGQFFMNCTDDELYSHMGSSLVNAKTFDAAKMQRLVTQQICGELLPHCGYESTEEIRFKKAIFLGLICRRLLSVQLGQEDADDRDFEGFKSLQMCSTTLAMLLRQLMGQFSKTLRKRIFDRVKDGKSVDVDSIILHMDCMPGVASAFTDGEVTVQKDASNSGKEVIQLVQQVNPLSLQSHIAKINTPLPKSGKYPQCRNIDTSQLFSICPVKTPEGEGAGLLQNLTIMSKVRVPIDMEDLEPMILSMDGVIPLKTRRGVGSTLVLLNSDPIGRSYDPESLLDSIRNARREPGGALPPIVTAVFTPIGLLISSDNGVITFPLLHVPSLSKLPEAIAESEFGGVNMWQTLCNYGIVEYVDAWEALDMTVAFKIEDVYKSATPEDPYGGYTHLAPHPTCFLSTAAGTIPFANHNQAPRNTYQSGMAEQAISAPCLSVFDRDEMNYRHVLWYPQKPVCTTHIAEVKGLNTWPMGSNAILAIAPYFTSEDSITFSQSSADFGMMRISVYRSHRAVAKRRGTDVEVFEHPQMTGPGQSKCVGFRGECDYSKIGADGLPLPGTWIKANDVIIGRTGKVNEIGPDGDLREVRRDRSVVLYCDASEMHVVDKVIVTENKDGNRLVRVTTRSTRHLQCGDKLSSRHGQKGTVGTMLRPEDMPFVTYGPNEGMRPDIIINLQCINGRMTIGKLLEMLYGSLGVVQAEIQDATPFFNVNAKWALEELVKSGYNDTYTMTSGTTGEQYEKPWFLGVCFYQRLKHHVLDKIAARARGLRAVLTRQPVDGRANNGGQKFGEMEFDSLKASGASSVLYDRSVLASDVFNAQICTKCGIMGEISTPSLAGLVREEGYFCRACESENTAVSMDTTWCYSGLLVKELQAMNIGIEHHIGKRIGGGDMVDE